MHGIFLFHDIQKHTVDDIDQIIDGLIQGGCETFVTISDYLNRVNKRQLANISAARNMKKKKPASPGMVPPPAPLFVDEIFTNLRLIPCH